MDEHALELLEFPRVLDELAGLCASPVGAELIRGQGFLSDRAALDERLALSLEFRAVLESGVTMPGLDFPELGDSLRMLGKEGLQLEGEELAAIGRWILSGLKLRRLVDTTRPAGGPLAALAAGIPDLAPLSRRIFHVLDPEGTLREKQIPSLAAIRERIRRYRDDADRSLRSIIDEHAGKGYWQTTTPTQRDGRVVLPLKAQHKGKVRGIVHEMSSSGSTVFIEPLEIVEKNNAIVQEENLYRVEMRRILKELTAAVSGQADAIDALVRHVALVDTYQARARYAIQHSCRRAEPDPRALDLREARHPLLGSRVVPLSVRVDADQRILIITGPNTGGKTVSLKTVGLMALMNQFGVEIPAAEGSTLPLFDSVFADIGDEQSIEQSLSTFSAHVKNLAGIVREAGPRSLVLLDELGAGTDPQEGVALAMALLDHFMATGCRVLVSTHHGILKNYGATRPGAQNASMGFDRDTFAPTYRILMGVPGESHALEIARRTGMPEGVMAAAFSYLDDERTDISHLVSHLAERHQKLSVAEEEQKALERELMERRSRAEQKELTLREKELELRRHGLAELRDFIGQARKDWERLRGKSGSPDGAEFQRLAASIQARIEEEETMIELERESLAPASSFEVSEGMDVVIARTGRPGRVLRRDKGKRWVVETETLRLSLLPGELRPAPKKGREPTVSVQFTAAGQMDTPVLELYLIGMRVEEAMKQVERQVDAAMMHSLKEFSIVHGKGEGKLRTAIHAYLKGLPLVSDFRFSKPEEGGYGKTIVTLKV
jgi:DNA mismatch repair protein MutS2